MVPTRTTIAMLVLGLLLWLPCLTLSILPENASQGLLGSWAIHDLALANWFVFGFDAAVLLLVVLDAILARRASHPRYLTLHRERPARLSVGIKNEIFLVILNRNRLPLYLVLRDLPPAQFPARPDLCEVRVAGLATVRVGYRLLPTDRGDYQFGDVYLRCRGPMGLACIDRRVPAAERVQVFPNLLQIRRYEALVRSTLVLSGGSRIQRRPGSGREFSHFRDYTPDDDYRHVNWKASARRTRPVTAVFESEHSQDIIFCLDVGRLMATRVGTLTKLDHAINAVLMLAHVSQTFQDNLGLLVFSHKVHCYLPPAKGKGQQARFLQALYDIQADLCAVNYREAFTHLISRHPKRCLTMVFTDLLDDVVSVDYLEASLLLKRFHLPLTLAIADVPLQESARRRPESPNDLADILVAREVLHARTGLLQHLERQGLPVLDTIPERLTSDAVNRYLTYKTGVQL